MVRYLDVAGNANAQRNARGKHFVQFDLAIDKGAELKTLQPDLGWVPDQDGHPTLPFSIAARLLFDLVMMNDHIRVYLFQVRSVYPSLLKYWYDLERYRYYTGIGAILGTILGVQVLNCHA